MVSFLYFGELLVSHYEGGGCCLSCILTRYFNTRKDRAILKKSNAALGSAGSYDFIFQDMARNIELLLNKDINLVDEFGRRKVVKIDSRTLNLETSYCNPVPDCEYCSTLPIDSEELAYDAGKQMLQEINSKSNLPFRKHKSVFWGNWIDKLFLDKNFGVISCLLDYFGGSFPTAIAMLPLENGIDEPGSGRTSSIDTSRAIAMIEALERYAGFRPRGKITKIFDSLYQLEQENYPVFEIQKFILNQNSISNKGITTNNKFIFDSHKKYHWVYGYNLTSQNAVLIPETLVYYGLVLKDSSYRDEIFTYEISNGCSTGGSLLESSYYGLLEVIERDSFLTMWYFDRRIIEIDFSGNLIHEELIDNLVFFSKKYQEFKLRFFDISTNLTVKTVMCTIQRISVDKKKMNFMCATSSDFSIEEAMCKAMHEITSIFFGLEERFIEEYDDVVKKSKDITLIHNMTDHCLVYGHFEKIKDITFWDRITEIKKVEDYMERPNFSLNKAYSILIDELRKQDKDILVFDQTTEEMKKIGLYCTKTMVPGLLPMTFGYNNLRISQERVEDLERYEQKRLKVNFQPHPFP